MTSPAEEIDKQEYGDFVVTFYRRLSTLTKDSGWSKTVYFHSITIARRSPHDGKMHKFFREKDVDTLINEVLPKVRTRITELRVVSEELLHEGSKAV